MISILSLTVILLSFATRVESSTPVTCIDFSTNIHFRGDNIALNRPVSHTPATYAGDKYKATLAADGDFDTTFRLLPPYTCSLTNRNNETSPTWTVTLDNLYQITGIVIFNRRNARHRRRLANFTVFGTCDGLEKIVLYDDAQHNRHQLEVIKLEINDTHLCSSISIQIPQEAVSGHVQYLSLCGVQIYAAVCSKPTSPFFTEISPNKKWYIKDESFNFQCKIGYRPSPSNTIVSCCGVDTFCPSSPICKRVYCQLPSQPNNGKYNTSTSTNTSLEYGSVIYGECNIGYKEGISGTTRRCQQNGTWSGQDLVCTQIICNPPPGLQNGYYTYTNNSEYNNTREPYNTNLTGHCNVGYKHSTPSTISCGLDESWTGDARRSNKGFKLTETAERSNIATIGCVPYSSNTTIDNEDLRSARMAVGVILGTNVFTAIITTVIVYIVIKRCRKAKTKPNDLYGDLALRNTSREQEYSDLQNIQHN